MPHVLNDAQYAAIGRVAAEAARLDAVLEGFLADALTHDTEVALIAINGMFFERKADMLEAILDVRLQGGEEVTLFKRFLAEARRLMKDRNEFLHGLWQFDADANLQVRTRVRKTRKFKVRPVSIDDLTKTAHQITFVANELEGLWMDLLVDVGAYVAVEPGIWQQIAPHRPRANVDEAAPASYFVVDLIESGGFTADQ